MNWFDTIVILVTCLAMFAPDHRAMSALGALRVARLLKVMRMVRIVAVCARSCRASFTCMRHITGENKQRFLSAEHDFDLDLAFVTPQLISMSVPAADCLVGLYRNPISEVVRFFERFHA